MSGPCTLAPHITEPLCQSKFLFTPFSVPTSLISLACPGCCQMHCSHQVSQTVRSIRRPSESISLLRIYWYKITGNLNPSLIKTLFHLSPKICHLLVKAPHPRLPHFPVTECLFSMEVGMDKSDLGTQGSARFVTFWHSLCSSNPCHTGST